MKKIISLLCAALFIATTACAQTSFDKTKAVKDTKRKTFNNVDGPTVANKMKTGWNLGNTLDATNASGINSETSWGMPKTTKAMIDELAKSGIKTIRIPVSWSNHLIDKNYTIDPVWMKRVKEIVDWSIENDMYVILNIHHDCYEKNEKIPEGKGYFYPTTENYEVSRKFFENVWSQICLAFNNGYDEHLIFETINEPRLRGTEYEWWFDPNNKLCLDAADILNKFNQVCVDTIRKSGGNNAKRFIMVPGLQASPETVFTDAFKLPKDTAKNRLFVSVHMYSPYKFAMETPGVTAMNPSLKSELAMTFKKLNEKFISKGIPVIIGEYGATNKGNLAERVEWFTFFITFSRKYNMPSCLWDNGQFQADKKNGEKFGFYNRHKQKWEFPEICNAIMEAAK